MRSVLSVCFVCLLSVLPSLNHMGLLAMTRGIPCVNFEDHTIHEGRYVQIGGIEQWITINGDKSKPVLLFLHGGPGSPLSPFADAIYGEWEKEFVLVQWDQRGAGRTYGRNAPDELDMDYVLSNPLTIERMVKDGIELTEYLLEYLGKRKIVLLGSSWGSVLGATMAVARPDLYYAYLAHAQIVYPNRDLPDIYDRVVQIAQSSGDNSDMEQLQKLESPPYNEAKTYGRLFRIIKKYERARAIPPPETWWELSPEYDNEKDNADRYNGDDFSFINYVGHKKLGVKAMKDQINMNENCMVYKVPVYMIQGMHDILTPKEITRAYFDSMKAPDKEYYLVQDAAHGFNETVIDMHYKILTDKLLPMIASDPKN